MFSSEQTLKISDSKKLISWTNLRSRTCNSI